MTARLEETVLTAIEYADTDTLLRAVDGMCERAAWDELTTLRTHCQAAVERGKQVWSIDEHVRYRLALQGPDELAAHVVEEGPARFTLGPLTEVVAQRHRWEDIEPHLGSGPEHAVVAHECSIRGQRFDAGSVDTRVLEIPVALAAWEPQYPVATYRSDRAQFPSPPQPSGFEWIDLSRGETIEDAESEEALLELVTPWTTTSNGVAEVRSVDGDARAAVAALGLRRAGMVRVDPSVALAWMGWAAASGGAYGRRRGAAAGRFHAWWAAAVLAGLDVPPAESEMRETLGLLEWFLWTDGLTPGWTLRLAVADPEHRVAWALTAVDEKNEPEPDSPER